MAIRSRGNSHQVYWVNPITKKQDGRSFNTLAEAREFDSQIKHRLKFDRESFKAGAPTGSVADLLDRYVAQAGMEDSSVSSMKSFLITLKEAFPVQVSEVNKAIVRQFFDAQTEKGNKPTTIQRKFAVLRAAFNWAYERDEIQANPLAGIKTPKGRSERIAPPTIQEMRAIISVAPEGVKRAILVGLHMGVRMGPCELMKMKWSDYDEERGTFRVWSAKKNTEKPFRDVPVSPKLNPLFEQWRADGSEYVIHHRGKPIKQLTSWVEAKKKAGITRKLRLYDFRHAFATYSLANGADILAVADIMGHANPKMVLTTYGHVLEKNRRSAVDSIPGI